jgi:hypothetical protein
MKFYNPIAKVITIDPRSFKNPEAAYKGNYNTIPADCMPFANEMVTFLVGYTDSEETKSKVNGLISEWKSKKIMLIEDSHHTYDMVLANAVTGPPRHRRQLQSNANKFLFYGLVVWGVLRVMCILTPTGIGLIQIQVYSVKLITPGAPILLLTNTLAFSKGWISSYISQHLWNNTFSTIQTS